jgi:hypothetical protein
MNPKMATGMILLLLALTACEPVVRFTQPQPVGAKVLAAFPERLQGIYRSRQDFSLLQITDRLIVRVSDFDEKIHVSQLDSTQQLIGDSLYDLVNGSQRLVHIEGDSLLFHIHESDTLFRMDSQHVLKKFKGYYFISEQTGSDEWGVHELGLSRGILGLGSITTREEIELLGSLTESPQDTLSRIFNPDRSEFRKFIRNEGFRSTESFVRISPKAGEPVAGM